MSRVTTSGRNRGRGLGWMCGVAVGPLLALAAASGPAWAQGAPAAAAPAEEEDEEAEVSELVIIGSRAQPGAVIGDITPELQLNPADVRSYGVSSISELMAELAPQTSAGGGRGGAPIVLLNGRRISGFNEIRDIPTEAIVRVDILPEEAALKYGYPAGQRVVNFVLRRRFRAVTTELTGGGATEGGQAFGKAEANYTRILRQTRLNVAAEYQSTGALHEDDRDLVPLTAGQAFDLAGNLRSPVAGGELDPALSALAGRTVTVAGAPAVGATRPLTLADLRSTAGVLNSSDVGAFRTLTAATRQASLNAVYSLPIFGNMDATVNATLEASSSDSDLGLAGVSLLVPAGNPFSPFARPVTLDRYVAGAGPLEQATDTWTAHLGATVNRDLGQWRLSLTGAYDHTDSKTETDTGLDATALQAALNANSATLNPFASLPLELLPFRAQNTGKSKSDTGNIQLLATGPAFKLPAGDARTSLKVGASAIGFDSRSTRLGVERSVSLSRTDLSLQGNLDLPIASEKNGFLAPLGELSANLNAAVDRVSDFGTLTTLGYGLNWTPVTGLRFIASRTQQDDAPTVQQLGDPTVLTAGRRLYDFATGQTVEVVQVSGGNAGLRAAESTVTKLGVTWKPFSARDLTFSANYLQSRSRNLITTFPAATAVIEAAFPERFTRDASGALVQVDYRPVNFASQDRKELRWGLNYSRGFGPQIQPPPRRQGQGQGQAGDAGPFRPPGGEGGPRTGAERQRGGDGPPPGFGGGRGFGGFGGRGGPRQAGRLQVALYHTAVFENEILIRPGVPVLDLLDGAAAGNGGGQARNALEGQLGVTYNGLGMRLNGTWTEGTTVSGVGGTMGDLRFSDIAKVNLRLFADLGQRRELVQKHPWLRGSRISLSVNNLFNERVDVRAADGSTPVSYQPAYLDPAGRTVRLSIRKLLF